MLRRHILTIAAAITVGACADDRSISAPQPPAVARASQTIEAGAVTVTIDQAGQLRTLSGYAHVTGTVTCAAVGQAVTLRATANQQLKKEKTDNPGRGEVSQGCSTDPTTFEIVVYPIYSDRGPFKRGKLDVQVAAFVADIPAAAAVRSIRLEPIVAY